MFKSKRLKNVSNPFKSNKSSNGESKGSATKQSKTAPISKNINVPQIPSVSSNSKLFNIRELFNFGMNGKVISLAFDYTQSLLALATETGELHIYGQNQVEVIFSVQTKAPIVRMSFVKGIYLVAVDAKDTILVMSIYSKKVLTTVFSPSKVTCMETDPSLDWVLFGLQSGSVIIYDIDRNQMSTTKIENLQKSKFFPKDRLSPVVSIQWNPRDVGTILISYEQVTVTYSLIDAEIKQQFIYDLPPFAPGGDPSKNVDQLRRPTVIQSLYHPNSLHILTVHADNSLVFWDANTGQLIQARSLLETDVNIPQQGLINNPSKEAKPDIVKIAWIAQNNPEYTSLLIATKSRMGTELLQGFTMIDLGGTPLYTITSYDGMSNYYSKTTKEKYFVLNNKSPMETFLPIPRRSPYFAGCHDPGFILILLEDGEVETLLYPSGFFTSKASLFPPNLSWIRPAVTKSMAVAVPKKVWLGMMSANANKDSLLKGGMLAKKPIRRQEFRSAIVTGHTNGSVRIWDASHGEIDDAVVFDINVAQILNRSIHISVEQISFATETLELAMAVETGDVVLFKFETNQFFDPQNQNKAKDLEMEFRRFSLNDYKQILIDVRSRASKLVKQGFMPSTVVHANKGKVSALKNSNIGFVGIGYEDGTFYVIDRRGPAIIYGENMRHIPGIRSQSVTSVEFAIMEYGEDGYSSILLFCGTDAGELITYKILPEVGGRFGVQFVEVIRSNDHGSVLEIEAFAKDTHMSCSATIAKMQALSKGLPVAGYVSVSGLNDVRILKMGKSKESHKSFKYPLAATGVSTVPILSPKEGRKFKTVLTTLLVNGDIKIFSVPDLKELKSSHSPAPVHSQYIRGSSVLSNGEVAVRVSQYKMTLLTIVSEDALGSSSTDNNATDTLYNPNLRIPYRPQVNTLQWARGTVYCTPDQLDLLLGGERRSASKYKESAIANGTLTLKPTTGSNGRDALQEHGYTKPIRHATKGRYSVLKSVSRTVETHWDALEDGFNDYATALGEGMNDAVEQTGKDIVKGSLGI